MLPLRCNDIVEGMRCVGQCSAGWMRAVGRGRNEADGALVVAATFVIAANSQQTSVFALRACIGLH